MIYLTTLCLLQGVHQTVKSHYKMWKTVNSYIKHDVGIDWKTTQTSALTSCPSLNGSEESSFFKDEEILVFWKDN